MAILGNGLAFPSGRTYYFDIGPQGSPSTAVHAIISLVVEDQTGRREIVEGEGTRWRVSSWRPADSTDTSDPRTLIRLNSQLPALDPEVAMKTIRQEFMEYIEQAETGEPIPGDDTNDEDGMVVLKSLIASLDDEWKLPDE